MRSSRRAGTTLAATVLAATLAATVAAPAGAANNAHELDLTLLATTDVHGRVMDWDYFKDAPYSERSGDTTGLARVASVVKDVRAKKGKDHVVVVDNGDAIQGTPLSYYYAVQEPVTRTGTDHPVAQAFNTIGYDAQVVGNHEFNYGLDLLGAYAEDLDDPLLGANVIDAATGKPYLQPYTLVRRQVPGHKPVTVGVLGLTTPGSAIWDKNNVEGKVTFDDMVATAKTWVPKMRAAGAEVVVVLSHAGTGGGSSYDSATIPAENPSDVIARTVPGIDVMVVGHTHLDRPSEVVVNEQTGKKALLTQPYRWGATVSEVDLQLVKERGRWSVKDAAAAALRTKDYREDPAVLAALADEHATTVSYVNQVIAQSTAELPAAESRYKDTAILDYIQQVQTETVDAALEGTDRAGLPVLSLAAPFSRTALFPQGDVTVRDMAGLYIFDNTLEAVEMTGAQVDDYLEFSAGKYFATVPAGGTFDPESGTNLGGQPDYNYDTLAGLDYTIDLAAAPGHKVTLTHADGTPVRGDERFVVAVNNYRRSGGGGFPHVATAPVVYNQQLEIRQLLIDWAQQHKVIDPADFSDENWRLVVDGVPAV